MKKQSERRTVLSIIALDPKKIGGVEAYARELSRQLGERGCRSVLCFLAPPPAEIRDYFDSPDLVLESLNIPATGVNYYLRLIYLLLRYRPTILHLHLVSLFGPYGWTARLLGVKMIFFTDHSSRPSGFFGITRPSWKQWLFRVMMAPLTRVVCVSGYVRDSFVSLGLLPAERSTVVYNGVDLARVEAGQAKNEKFRKSLGLSSETFLVLQVGQIIPEKGVPDLLEAATKVCQVNQSVHFLFVGDGDHLTEYRNLASSLGLADNVTFTGPIADPLLSGVFAAADLVCQVSRWEEAFGLVIAEAMASARPVLATRTGGIPELVKDGVTGYTVERGDVNGMVSRILELSGQQERCITLGLAGQKVCREKFNLHRNVTQLLNLYGMV